MSLELVARVRFALVLLALAGCPPPGYGKHHGVDASGPSVDAPAGTVDAAMDASTAACNQSFRLDGYAIATTVVLTGDFTHWAGTVAAGAIAMTKGADGAWTLTYGFARGSYLYKFVVDGSSWIADPTNPITVDDGFGGKNSVYTCQ
jgi:hypothetical protein